MIPPNWDSWGKIRVLRDGFDVDLVSNGWSIDLDQPFPRPQANGAEAEDGTENGNGEMDDDSEHVVEEPEGSTVALYEESVQDPTMDALQLAGRDTHSTALEVETIDTQTFLGQQLKVLDAFKQKNEEAAREESRQKPHKKMDDDLLIEHDQKADARVLEHIGPVQFNMGGIQVDADDMVQRLKVRFFFFTPGSYPRSRPELTLCYRSARHLVRPPSPRAQPLRKPSTRLRKWTRRTCRRSSTA